jgi:DNA-binding LytR/AlgR family response regulator
MLEEIKILIIEDESIWSDALKLNLNEFGFEVVAVIDNTADAITAIRTLEYDLVLLDIFIGSQNSGLELGKLLSTLYHKPFIFVTSSLHTQIAKEAITSNPSGYLIKPIKAVSLFVAIQTALNNYQSNQIANPSDNSNTVSFFVKLGNKYTQINWKDVISLNADGKYIQILTTYKKEAFIIRRSLKSILSTSIPQNMQKRFIQINRSEVINADYIKEIIENGIITPQKTYYISGNYLPEVKTKLNILT